MVSISAEMTHAQNPAWLADCVDPQQATDVIGSALSLQDDHWRTLQVRKAEIVRLKAAKRCLVSYVGDGVDQQSWQFIGKIRFKGIDRKIGCLSRYLQDHGIGHVGRPCKATAVIPRVWGEVACWNMILFEYLEGESLAPDRHHHSGSHALVADALSDLHSIPIDRIREAANTFETDHSVADELEILRKAYVQFSADWPQWAEQAWRIWYHLQSIATRVHSNRRCLIHRDFYFDQALLLREDKVALLDLDLACLGPPTLDAGNYIAHLREMAIRNPELEAICSEAEKEFTARFLRRANGVGDGCQHLSFWILVAMARLAAISVRFPDRLHTTERLLQVVELELLTADLF